MTKLMPISASAWFTNTGQNWVAQFQNPVTIIGYDVGISVGFLTSAQSLAEVLVVGELTPTAPVFGPLPNQTFNGPLAGNGDVGPMTMANAAQGAGGYIYSSNLGSLFSGILKTWAPTAQNQRLCKGGLSLAVPAGAYFTLHADGAARHQDASPNPSIICAFEAWGTIFYE